MPRSSLQKTLGMDIDIHSLGHKGARINSGHGSETRPPGALMGHPTQSHTPLPDRLVSKNLSPPL